MKTKIEIKSIFGKLLFEFESENNNVKKTLLEAIKKGADLSDANLSGANLSDAKNKETAYMPIFCRWSHSIFGDRIQIGCEKRTVEEWDSFFASNEQLSTPRGTEQFKQIEAVYNALKAYYLTLNEK